MRQLEAHLKILPETNTYPSDADLQTVLLLASRSQLLQPVGQMIGSPVLAILATLAEVGGLQAPLTTMKFSLQLEHPVESQTRQLEEH